MLTSHEEDVLRRVRAGTEEALAAMGDLAVALARAQMRGGYAQPVIESGALLADVTWARTGEASISVGNTLPYARAVHNGTSRMAARPYLTDALESGAQQLFEAAAQVLRDRVG